MNVTPTGFTIAEYCQQMREKSIIVNHDYQRSDKVWPPVAKSYLIETVLLGFPIPKLSLYQTTDLKTRRTTKEIVDGQQRSQTIFDFLEGEFRISGKGPFGGKIFNQLEENEQQQFVSYALTVDLFVNATRDEIRQVFRRMNSYTVPLNPQEQRHATHQGEFKWFIVELVERYAESFKKIGVFSERQLSRMSDAALLSDIVYTFENGIQHANDKRLDKYYADNDAAFPAMNEIHSRITTSVDVILGWPDIHKSPLMKSYNFYSLILAISHALRPAVPLNSVYERQAPIDLDPQFVLPNLTALADALEEPMPRPDFEEFVNACAGATTRIEPRNARFRWLSQALEPKLL
jgi:Protein of unknown function DUF262